MVTNSNDVYDEIEEFANSLPIGIIEEIDNTYSRSEVVYSGYLIKWLENYTSLSIDNQLQDQIQPELLNYCNRVIEVITKHNIGPLNGLKTIDILSEQSGTWLQNTLKKKYRKSLASNYTQESSQVVGLLPNFRELVSDDKIDRRKIKSICDHFCGSGNLLTSYLDLIEDTDQELPSLIRINDIMASAVLLTYCRLRAWGYEGTIHTSIGDGFQVDGIFDLVLINPPYTRSHRISKTTKKFLKALKPKIELLTTKYNTKYFSIGHTGLHFWAILQLSDLLSADGQAILILPKATLNAVYSQILKYHLIDSYKSIIFAEYEGKKAFSEGSDLKELVLYIDNLENNQDNDLNLLFCKIEPEDFEISLNMQPNLEELYNRWNWGIFFLDKEALRLEESLRQKIDLKTTKEAGITIKRGIELYGPDLFFFPNRRFQIENNGSQYLIREIEGNNEFNIDKSRFVKILRQPRLYTKFISPEINHFALTLDNDLNTEEISFVNYIQPDAGSARRKFGDEWFFHPRKQLEQKKPIGHIFIIDKLDLTSTPTLAYFTPDESQCTKNFYVIQSKKLSGIEIEFLAAWLNSTHYLLLYLLNRREIGGTYGRMQIIDYDFHELFPSKNQINHKNIQPILNIFREIRNQSLPTLDEQIFHTKKVELDQAFIDYFDLEYSIDQLHTTVAQFINSKKNN